MNLDTILKKCVIAGLFFIPFVPLIVSSSMFFPFITGKGFAFRIVIEIIFACWALLALSRPEYRPRKSFLLYAVLAFLGIVFVADMLAENPFKAFWSNFERMEGFITLIHLGAYFLVASSVFKEEKWWHWFFATSVGVSAMLGVYGLLQLAGKIVINQGGVRLDGTFGNAAYFAGYMLVHIFLTLFLILRHKIPSGWKWLYAVAIVLQLNALYFTATRGAGLGLVCGLFVAAVLIAFLSKHPKLRIASVSVIAALILVVAGLAIFKESSFIQNNPVLTRFASISVGDASPRLMVWGMAVEGFKERPLLGWGQEGFNYVFNKYYNPGMWGQEQWFDRTHNIFFDWLISAGTLGLLAYLSLFGGVLWYLWRGRETDGGDVFSVEEKSVLTGLLAAYVVHNFFVFDNLISYVLFFSIIAYAHSRYKAAESQGQQAVGEQAYYTAAAVLLVALVVGGYYLNARAIGVSRFLIQGLKPQKEGILKNLEFYEQASKKETVGTQETAEQLMQTAATIASATNVPQDTKGKFVELATRVMQREIDRAPEDARLRMFMGGFLSRLGRSEEALAHLERAHELSPKKQTIAFEVANAYVGAGKSKEALVFLKEAFESAPAFDGARIAYAATAIYAKDFALADRLFASSTNPNIVTDERIVKAYFETKQFGKVIALLEMRLRQKPDDPQTHVSLAAVYMASGNRSAAIAALQKAIELDPKFKDQGEYYIAEIRAGRNP